MTREQYDDLRELRRIVKVAKVERADCLARGALATPKGERTNLHAARILQAGFALPPNWC